MTAGRLGYAWPVALAVALACMAVSFAQPAPQVRAQARLAPAGPLPMGATAALQVDVLTSTWFTQPPELPSVQLAGALVAAPSGRAELLRATIDGVAYSGLRYAFQISPTQPGNLDIPALQFTLHVGQAPAPMRVRTEPLTIAVEGLPAGAEHAALVASAVAATQAFDYSHQPLRVGDRVARQVTLSARGAQAMLIPAPPFADVDGLKRYPAQPRIAPLTDEHGGFLGGQRIDRVEYVTQRAGHYELPAIDIAWWDTGSRRMQRITLPAQRIEVDAAAAYQGPFSVAQDLDALKQQARLHVSGATLAAVAATLVLVAAGWLARRRWRELGRQLAARIARARRQWQASEPYAWLALRRWLREPMTRLDALYHWLWRVRGLRTVAQATAGLPPALATPPARLLRAAYASASPSASTPVPDVEHSRRAVRAIARPWRRALRVHTGREHGPLLPLNPEPGPGANLVSTGDPP